MLAPVDPVGVYHDIALLGLPEDPGQAHHAAAPGTDDVLQDAAGTHGGKLVHIPHQDQLRPDGNGHQKGVEQKLIHHRHLIDDDHILLQRSLLVTPEGEGSRVRVAAHLEQPVDGAGFVARRLRHPFSRAPRGRGQGDIHAHGLKVGDHRVDRRGLAGTGAARDDHQPAARRLQNGLTLQLVQLQPGMLFNASQPGKHLLLIDLLEHVQVMKHSRAAKLLIVGGGCVHAQLLLPPDHDLLLHHHVPHLVVRVRQGDVQQSAGPMHHLVHRQVDVPLRGGLQQDVEDAAADAEIRVGADAGLPRDLIGHLKADPGHLVRQLVGVLPDDPVDIRAVALVELDRHIVGDAVLLQEQHGPAHILLLFHLPGDLDGLAPADALDLGQPLRLHLDDPEGLIPELLHDPRRQRGADPLDGAGPEIPLHGGRIARLLLFVGPDLKLPAVGGVLRKLAPGRDLLPFRKKREGPHAGGLLPVTDENEHRVPVLRIPVDNVIYIALNNFHPPSAPCRGLPL